MFLDINYRYNKLEKEQLKRKDDLKRKLIKENQIKQQYLQTKQLIIEENNKKLLEEQRKQEEKQKQDELEYIETEGIDVKISNLLPYEIEGNDDKVILSQDVLESLLSQDAYNKGPIYFKLIGKIDNQEGSKEIITYCGVREFTASKQTIGVTRKILDTLLNDSDGNLCSISIKYVRLTKCTYVKLQPKTNQFFSVGPIKQCLEENFRLHSTLSINDIVTVWYRGKSHSLKVIEMKPDSKGSLIDSDVEVDLDLSEEFQNKQESNSINNNINSNANTSHKLNDNTSMDIDNNVIKSERIPIDLPPEPEGNNNDIIAVKIRTPSGTITRKFLHKQSIKNLFHFVGLYMKEDINKVQLTLRYPAKAFTYNILNNDDTFENCGLTSSQEMFMASIIS